MKKFIEPEITILNFMGELSLATISTEGNTYVDGEKLNGV